MGSAKGLKKCDFNYANDIQLKQEVTFLLGGKTPKNTKASFEK